MSSGILPAIKRILCIIVGHNVRHNAFAGGVDTQFSVGPSTVSPEGGQVDTSILTAGRMSSPVQETGQVTGDNSAIVLNQQLTSRSLNVYISVF